MEPSSRSGDLYFEREMVLGEVSAFRELIKELEDDPKVFPHLDGFRDVVKAIHESIERTINNRLDLVSTAGLAFEEISRRIRALRALIHALHSFLYGTYIAMRPIPRQMYYLADHLLRSYDVKCDYVISVSDRIQIVSLSDLLKSYRCDLTYVEFWDIIKDREFYFVQIVSKISTPDRFLDWIMMLHEIGHIIDAEKEIVQRYIPELSVLDAIRIVKGDGDAYGTVLYEKAKKKLHATEFAADLIVTETYGGVFGWRLLKEYGHWVDVFEHPTTHPLTNQRVSIMIDELRSFLALEPVSRLLQAELQERGWSEDASAFSVIVELPQIRATIRTYAVFKLTMEKIRDELFSKFGHENSHPEIEDRLRLVQRNLLQGRPTILSPPLLYYVYIYGLWDSEITQQRSEIIQEMLKKLGMLPHEFEARIGELLSDCVRLFCVREEW